jgi:predicted ATPase
MENRKAKRGFHIVRYSANRGDVPLFINEDIDEGPKASIIIGPNGSGKSRVLASIVDELTVLWKIREAYLTSDMENQNIAPRLPLFSKTRTGSETLLGHEADLNTTLTYWLDGAHWETQRQENKAYVWKNGLQVNVSDLQLPDKVLAIAHLPIDKFKYATRSDRAFYHYLGLRQAGNMTSTGSIESGTFFDFLNVIKNGSIANLEKNWFESLELRLPVFGQVSIESKSLAYAETQDIFINHALDWIARRRGPATSRLETNSDEITHELGRLWPFINELRSGYNGTPSRVRGGVSFMFELFPTLARSESDIDNIVEILEIGRRFRILGNFGLCFHKHDRLFPFSELSSGEQHILSTVTKIVANIGGTTAVFIDEPEVSLHPAWQARYVPSLLTTLENSPSTHVVIATHSHFLVADLHPKNGSLTIAKSGKTPSFAAYDGEVFGRSPDNILYRVFGIGSAGNRYVEHDLKLALQMISGTGDLNEPALREIYERLLPLAAPDNLALAEILSSIATYLENRGNAQDQ